VNVRDQWLQALRHFAMFLQNENVDGMFWITEGRAFSAGAAERPVSFGPGWQE